MTETPNSESPRRARGTKIEISLNDAVFIAFLLSIMALDVWISSSAINLLFGITIVAIQFLLIKILGRVLKVSEAESWLEIFTPTILGVGARGKRK